MLFSVSQFLRVKSTKGKATQRSVFSSLYSCAPTHNVYYIFQICDGQDLSRRVNKDKIHATHVCMYASVPPARPGWLYFGSCPEGQISSRTNVPSTFQNKQPVIHRCQLTLNFLSIATTTTICHHDTAHRAPTPSKHTHVRWHKCMHAHTQTYTQDKVLSYLTINIELKPRITNTHAYTNTQPGVQISRVGQFKTKDKTVICVKNCSSLVYGNDYNKSLE